MSDPLAREIMAGAGDLVGSWREAGWLRVDESGLRLTAEGWLRMDELVAALGCRAPAMVNGNGLREGDDVPQSDRA